MSTAYVTSREKKTRSLSEAQTMRTLRSKWVFRMIAATTMGVGVCGDGVNNAYSYSTILHY